MTNEIAQPADIELERAVIARLLTDSRAFPQMKDALDNLLYFTDPTHRRIFGICRKLANAGETITPANVWQKLGEGSEQTAVDAHAFQLIAQAEPVGRGLRGRIFRLQDLYLRRVLIHEAKKIIEKASISEGDEIGFETLSTATAFFQKLRYKVAKFMGGY